jgi:hypothetical protein
MQYAFDKGMMMCAGRCEAVAPMATTGACGLRQHFDSISGWQIPQIRKKAR